jgi:hypothetical protein
LRLWVLVGCQYAIDVVRVGFFDLCAVLGHLVFSWPLDA